MRAARATARGRTLPPAGPEPALSSFLAPASLAAGLRRAAASDAPILLVGEPGTGRSTVARELHRASRRADGPFVVLDPGSIPVTLFESELFGHRAGAFTGASGASPGRLGQAEGGTLVLDRVEALPLGAQPKLLRLLAERRYSPLGGRERSADVRFLALAGEDLTERVERGSFRRDLYYRLEVLAFRLPPLRERADELEEILERVLADLADRMGVEGARLSPSARKWMLRHPWPGNLREVRNVLERALILAGGGEVDPPPPRRSGEAPPRPLDTVEEEAIRRALAYTRGHQGKAAELLGISRKTLWQKRRRYGIA